MSSPTTFISEEVRDECEVWILPGHVFRCEHCGDWYCFQWNSRETMPRGFDHPQIRVKVYKNIRRYWRDDVDDVEEQFVFEGPLAFTARGSLFITGDVVFAGDDVRLLLTRCPSCLHRP